MPVIRVDAKAMIAASPTAVYEILADYERGHPAILPPRYFRDLVIEKGGRGAGTIVRFTMRTLGSRRPIRAAVAEPEPGRVLEEVDLETGAVTTFTVAPAQGSESAQVTITTSWTGRGLRGWVESKLAPPLLRRIYADELQRLAAVAAK